MPLPATHADSLRIYADAVEVSCLALVGTIAGVRPLAVAALCGRGTARLRSDAAGTALSFRAPGSITWGPWVAAGGDGSYLLEDGETPSKWIRVQVYAAYLLASPQEARIALTDQFNNAIGSDNVSAAEASAGDVETYTVTLQNDSVNTISGLKAWLDAAVDCLEISHNGADWVAPTSEAAALALADVPAAAAATLHLRRTIAAAAPSDPSVLNLIHLAFDGL